MPELPPRAQMVTLMVGTDGHLGNVGSTLSLALSSGAGNVG